MMPRKLSEADLAAMEPTELLLPQEVATLFRVDPKTVTRWAQAGKVAAVKTGGGHRRFRAGTILALLRRGDGASDAAAGA